MRVAIREQLAALVLFAVLVALAIISIPTWIYVDGFVVQVEQNSLALTASLKAARLASEVELIQTICQTVSTRILIQQAFNTFYAQNASSDPSIWDQARQDLESAFSSTGFSTLLQGRLYSRNSSGSPTGLLNVTGSSVTNLTLPYKQSNGSYAVLGQEDGGYPPMLYPNITYTDLGHPNPILNTTEAFSAEAFPGVTLNSDGGLLLGPLIINESAALISLTVPVRSLNSSQFVLGYMTVVATASSLIEIQTSPEGLGSSGVTLFIGPAYPSNRFNTSDPPSNSTFTPNLDSFGQSSVHFILPPLLGADQSDRHSKHAFETGDSGDAFALSQFPAVLDAFSAQHNAVNNATGTLKTTNEQGDAVAVGVARPQSTLINWVVVVEQAQSEAYGPINTLRNILLGTVFGTMGLVLLLIFPCAHFSVMPIRRLKAATEKSIAPPGYEDGFEDDDYEDTTPGSGAISQRSEKGLMASLMRFKKKLQHPTNASQSDRASARRIFKIPGKVAVRRHCITDELTELTETFNEMGDELLNQYTSLDDKVAERTRELEISKKAAEAANESKTLFIANISHELKTPLNGIMGMCAVCMEEDDIVRIKQSLKTLYKSGDLLLHLLEDLLSFSKNQIGQQISLEEKEFRLGDIRSQILSIFDKQVRENKIFLTAEFVATDSSHLLELRDSPERTSTDKKLPVLGPPGIGRLKDMCLWGDQHRILQVLINLVSNSCKFTPPGGKVELRIRCMGEIEQQPSDESRASSFSQKGSARASRPRHRVGSSSAHSASSVPSTKNVNRTAGGTALAINPLDPKATPHVQIKERSAHSASSVPSTKNVNRTAGGTALAINPLDPKATPHVQIRERSPTPPPLNAKSFWFEFEVEDTGPGIAEHMQQKIFEPFVQGDLGLSKKYGGTGLGLSICSQLATIMGGQIKLKSTIGVGTTFTMRIPLKYVKERASSTASSSLKGSRPASIASIDGERTVLVPDQTTTNNLDKQPRLVGLRQPFFAANPNPPPSNAKAQMAAIDRAMANKSGQGKLRVLVADDNSTNIEVVSRMLKLEDVYDVTIAKDGQEAYDLVKANMDAKQHFDLIFMDIQMPNLDGLQSTRLIRKMGYSAPIVALTAFSEESNVKECMESGMDEFLSKPIKRPALKQVLQKFATIPEEPETASISPKTTPEATPADTPEKLDHVQEQESTTADGKAAAPVTGSAADDLANHKAVESSLEPEGVPNSAHVNGVKAAASR